MSTNFTDKYGFQWSGQPESIEVEFNQIRQGREWLVKQGRSLFFHYRNAFSLLWPKDDHNRWSDLILKNYLESEITVLMGCSDSCKTDTMSKIVVCDYWCFSDKTLWLVSSTEFRGAELRIWGRVKSLHRRGLQLFPHLPGRVIEYLHAISEDDIDEDGKIERNLQLGIIVIPCKSGTTQTGLSAYIGIKAARLRHAGDEVAVMSAGFLDAYSNWYGKEDFKGIMAGNFMQTDDPLGTAAEPVEGWDTFVDTEKTQVWKSKFYNATVIALDGRDSPNFDFPGDKARYPYMIGRKKLEATIATYGKDSWQWCSQCTGKPNRGLNEWRVLTKLLCKQHRAQEDVIWAGVNQTQIYAVDPAYGGGDRCIGRRLEFGNSAEVKSILKVYEPEIIPISVKLAIEPEEQIAAYVKNRLEQLSIPATNCFYDSFGRGTLGFAFAKVFGSVCPVPVDSGGKATDRPVRFDLYVTEKNGYRRLKTCVEHYSKFLSETWFSVRECIEAEQMRGLDDDTMDEGCSRAFKIVSGNRVEVEPKDEMKERTKKSPDKFDALAVGVEGARQLGFKIERLGSGSDDSDDQSYFDKESQEWDDAIRNALVKH